MSDQHVLQRVGAQIFLLLFAGTLAAIPSSRAAEPLPFDPSQICRLSVDNIPRSISIRQGADVWFGYDLETALVFKVWQAGKEKPGVTLKGFKAASVGDSLFEKKATDGWRITVEEKQLPLRVRYLGCVQNAENFELSWELSHSGGTIKLSERIATDPAIKAPQASRELRVESLDPGVSLELPDAYHGAWKLIGPEGQPVKSLSSSEWHQLSLR